jgi:xylan 1,4-beta-xylosidase
MGNWFRRSAPRLIMCRGARCRRATRRRAGLVITLGLLIMAGPATAGTITVDASKQTAGNPHFWSAAFGTGKAHLALRGDWQTHAKITNRELGAQRMRGHGLLNDEMGLYKGAGSYSWTNLDTYLSAISLANMRPIIETDFMPTALGSSSSDAMHSPPKDYNAWKGFISALVQHCVDKYGADDVAQWYFEIWNEPNYAGFWVNTDMNAYYTLYDNTVAAITSVIPNALVGGPAATDPSPVSAFLAHCKSAGTRVTFLSSHNYPGGASTGTSADPNSLVSDNDARIKAITGNGYTTSAVKSFNTEWNSSYSGQGGGTGDAITSMDNHWNVGFIIKAAKLLADKDSGDTPPIDIFSYWAFTDVFDESSGTDGMYMSKNSGNTPFGKVFGLMTFQGMRKAAFNAFKLLNFTGPKRLYVSGGADTSGGINAMATTSAAGDSLQILLYNYNNKLNTASGAGDSQAISVSGLPAALAGKEVFVTTYVVDEKNSNPYSVWTDLGSPATPSESDWQKMRQAQHLSVTTTKKTLTDATFSTTVTMLKQSGMLVILSVKRPLMGRDALMEIEGEDFDGQSGVTKEESGDSTTLGQSISFGKSGDSVFYDNVDFTDDGVSSVQLRVKSSADTTLELHQGSASGTTIAKCSVSNTSGSWATQSCTLSQAATGFSSTSPLYLVASGALHLNWIKFQAGGQSPGTGGSGAGGAGAGGATGTGAGGATSKGGAGGNGAGGAAGSGAGGATGKGGAGGNGAGGAAGGGVGGATARGGSAGNGAGGSSAGVGGNGSDPVASGGDSGGGGTASNSGGSGGSNGGSGGGSAGSTGAGSGAGAGTSGCSCRIGSTGGPSGAVLLVGLAALVIGLRRNRTRRGR